MVEADVPFREGKVEFHKACPYRKDCNRTAHTQTGNSHPLGGRETFIPD
jgi:hypothetical protein